ncbi:uncharacterized protein F5891DRAFT_1183223 [Suillus fuscotomentosus]|uniref:Uncharacterized protein n=1 Tax=Suillus fuscotomentosus TaxID=1912939 RepID=A0AAD4EFU1_9AGAM|nr:uncharacterized protein F5891DRAFT_1183223 [Suillus fuscotomentosus]KAG1905281.1 hypothetical protein F5891DRAFT_1183223 [Suillus fuscotomentosus]
MGHKDQRDDLKEALRKRDEQITCLEARVDAYIARTSETQARLLKTIDTVDSLKAQHVTDLEAKERERINLSHEIERWRTFAKCLEVERDDLKNVVEDLIQKVQMSSDWSMWPCSRMDITKHPYQLTENYSKPSDTSCRDSEVLLEYGVSLINRLRVELDHERKAHCKVVEEANLRICELEAKVAAREVVLEASIRHHQERDKSPPDRSRTPESPIPPSKPMTDEDCLRVLADSNTRNKSLEIEIRSLAQKLERARGSAASPACISADATPVVSPSSPPRIVSLDHPYQPAIPRKPLTTDNETHVTPTVHAVSNLPADSHVVTRPSSHNSPIISSDSASQRSIAQLDDQINLYATQLDAFKAERKTLVEVAVRKRRISDGGEPPEFPQILAIEEECVRLTSHVSHLEQELQHSRSSAKSREHELLKEIDALKLLLHQQSPNLYHAHDVQHLDDGIDIEQTMELGTPLQPTAILSWNDPGLTSFPKDPLLIPLPFSPERNSSPIISSSRPLLRPSSPHPVKLKRLEEGMEVARAQLAAKQLALDQLKIDMEELQHLLSEEPPGSRG